MAFAKVNLSRKALQTSVKTSIELHITRHSQAGPCRHDTELLAGEQQEIQHILLGTRGELVIQLELTLLAQAKCQEAITHKREHLRASTAGMTEKKIQLHGASM